MTKPSGAGHRPFRVLKELVASGEIELAPPTDKMVAAPRRVASSLSDEEAFAQGMVEVRRLGWSDTPLSLPVPVEFPKRADDEAEALVALAEFVEGRGEMDPVRDGRGRRRRFEPGSEALSTPVEAGRLLGPGTTRPPWARTSRRARGARALPPRRPAQGVLLRPRRSRPRDALRERPRVDEARGDPASLLATAQAHRRRVRVGAMA